MADDNEKSGAERVNRLNARHASTGICKQCRPRLEDALRSHLIRVSALEEPSKQDSESSSIGIKVVITVVIIIFAVVAAIVIAKLVDRLYDRKTRHAATHDIDDKTRELIQARLSVIQFKKKEIKKNKKERTLKVFRNWLSRVREKKSRENTLDSKRPPGGSEKVVITIDNVEKDKTENGVVRTPRFPFFTGASLAGGAQKPQKVPRQTSNTNNENTVPVSPVQKGRPVSSKSRVFPNVIVTNVDGNLPKVFTKAVNKSEEKNGIVPVDTVSKSDEKLSEENT